MSEEYYTTVENINETLDTKGLAILPGFLNENEIESMRAGFFETFRNLTGNQFNPDDEETWRCVMDLQPTQGMLFQNYGIGQAQVSWDLRQNPRVVDVFKGIYGVERREDLTVSMDGLAFSLPPEITNRGWATGPDNTHVDQCLYDNDPHWVQGWITANDVLEGDATFSFLPGSHLLHKEFREYKEAEELGTCPAFDTYAAGVESGDIHNWYVLQPNDFAFFEKPLERVKCPAGSLIIWDSRLFHSGSRPKKGRNQASTRMVSYVTYYPKEWLTDKQKKYHLETFTKGETSTHHFAKRFAKKPRAYGPQPEVVSTASMAGRIPPPVLTNLGKSLLDFGLKEPIDEFIEFCEINNAYPTAKTNSKLAAWFAKEKKKAKEQGRDAVDQRLHDLFEEEWWTKTRPKLE